MEVKHDVCGVCKQQLLLLDLCQHVILLQHLPVSVKAVNTTLTIALLEGNSAFKSVLTCCSAKVSMPNVNTSVCCKICDTEFPRLTFFVKPETRVFYCQYW